MLRRPPISTLTDTLFPNTTLFRSGPVLGQTEVAVIEGDTPATLATRVLIAEHQLYPRVLAELVTRETRPAALLDRLREIALTLPAAEEKLSHGTPAFAATGDTRFAYFSDHNPGQGIHAVRVKATP